jgi:hypothetical protein
MNNWFIEKNKRGVHDLTWTGVLSILTIITRLAVLAIEIGGIQ